MSFLGQYERVTDDRQRVVSVSKWIRNDWQSFFKELRAERPVFQIPGITLLTRHADVINVLGRAKEFSTRIYNSKMNAVIGPFMLGADEASINWRDRAMMQLALPFDDATRIRELVSNATKNILDAHQGEIIDVVDTVSRAVPIKLCSQYFGFHGPSYDTMKRWSRTIQWEFFKNLDNDPQVQQAAIQSGREIKEYLHLRIANFNPNAARVDNVMARLLSDPGSSSVRLSQQGLVSNLAGLLIGTVETSSQAIVQSLDQILLWPSVLRTAREAVNRGDEVTFQSIVWEALRFNPINPLLFRFVESDTVFFTQEGKRVVLRKGNVVFACTASAMHDERSIAEPDKFEIGRADSSYLHFGFGHHQCLGSFVGKILVTETLKQLLLQCDFSRLPGDGSVIDFQKGPFPEKYALRVAFKVRPDHRFVPRDHSHDGATNRFEFYALTRFRFAWRLAQRFRSIRYRVNRFLVNRAVNKSRNRPHALSTRADYTTWQSLTDRTYSGRHLPPAEDCYVDSLPSIPAVLELFKQGPGSEKYCEKSTLLFSHFAQWFTDGFLRTDRNDVARNTSNHDVDLSPLYGVRESDTKLIFSEKTGRLKSQSINGEEYPPFYHSKLGVPKTEFNSLAVFYPPGITEDRKRTLFATGVARGNNQVGFVMLSTLFLREHNRIATLLKKSYPDWNGLRIFETTRNILIVMLIKIVIEEYINHITPYFFKFRLTPEAFWDARWYRMNWMTVEFNLLYRWHSLVPRSVDLGHNRLPVEETFFNNQLLIDHGLGKWFDSASRQPSGKLGLFNTIPTLIGTDEASIKMGRKLRLRSYNDYRVAFGYPRVTDFRQISSSTKVCESLKRIYTHVDRIEFYVGLFAEDGRPGSPLSPLIGRMVGVDAFSQALTNPLLSANVFNEQTFSPVGWKELWETSCLQNILNRNVPHGGPYLASFTQLGKSVE